MVVSEVVLDALKSIGLNLYERKLWVSLLSRGTSSAGELSSLAKVPHSRTYDVLESLQDKGFVLIQNTKPLKYVAIEPKEALERAKKKIKEDADISIKRIDNMEKSPTVKELNKVYKNGVNLVAPGEMTASLKGKHAMHRQMETVFKGAKKSIHISTTSKGTKDLHKKHFNILKKAADRGVKIKIAAPHTKDNKDAITSLRAVADVRKSERGMGGRLAIVDNNHLVMSLTDEEKVHPTQDLGIWSQSAHAAGDVLGPMFNRMWSGLKSN